MSFIRKGEERPLVRIVFMEHVDAVWPLPDKWTESLPGGMNYAVETVAKMCNLNKNLLEAELSDPSYKASSLSAKAWADQHYIVVRAKDKGGLLEQNKRLHEMNERLLRKEVSSLGLTTKGKTPAIIEGTSKVEGTLDVLGQLEALKSENVDLKTEIAEHKMEIADLKKEIVELRNDRAQQKEINTCLVGRIQALEEKCLGMRPMEKVQMRKLIE